jgi:hypothetical protein
MDKKDKKRAGGRQVTMSRASSPAARPAPLVPAHDSTSDRILFCVLRLLPFRPRRAPPCPPRRAAPRPCALTGDGSRTVKTRSVPIVSQATPLSLCLAANNAHPMLHQIFSSLPSFATGLFPRASACQPWGRACVREHQR